MWDAINLDLKLFIFLRSERKTCALSSFTDQREIFCIIIFLTSKRRSCALTRCLLAIAVVQCHCYVCDVKAPCSLWGDGLRGGDHCHASDKKDERWKMLRQYNKTHPTGSSDPATVQHLLSPVPRPSSSPPAGKFDSSSLGVCVSFCRTPAPFPFPIKSVRFSPFLRSVWFKEIFAMDFRNIFGAFLLQVVAT